MCFSLASTLASQVLQETGGQEPVLSGCGESLYLRLWGRPSLWSGGIDVVAVEELRKKTPCSCAVVSHLAPALLRAVSRQQR